MPLRSPRTIAEATNESSNFDSSVAGYDAEAGTPAGLMKQGQLPSYAVNPTNPPEKPAPCTNLKG
jgi:hypothetical protein